MPVDARRFVRKMRGGAQAHLLEASDGHFYVVKFLNNPQHRRVLINEWIASTFLAYLGLPSPPVAMVRISEAFLQENPDMHIQLGKEQRPPVPGWHFGSRYPGDPARVAVYDFLPDTLLAKLENIGDFPGVLAFDQWIGNADSRQAVFFRVRVREGAADTGESRLGFIAQMIDNGYVFEGPHWRLADSPLQGLYFRPIVYHSVRGLQDFEPWLGRILHFPETIVDQALKQLPPAWLESDGGELERLLEKLLYRRRRVPDLIGACRAGKTNPFPRW